MHEKSKRRALATLIECFPTHLDAGRIRPQPVRLQQGDVVRVQGADGAVLLVRLRALGRFGGHSGRESERARTAGCVFWPSATERERQELVPPLRVSTVACALSVCGCERKRCVRGVRGTREGETRRVCAPHGRRARALLFWRARVAQGPVRRCLTSSVRAMYARSHAHGAGAGRGTRRPVCETRKGRTFREPSNGRRGAL
jgi:hypothetical protein